MYAILIYDINQRRVGKMLKLCRQYLTWIQNSVFEGEISRSKLEELKSKVEKIMKDDDSLIIFLSRDSKWLDKQILGKELNSPDNML